MRGRNHQLLSWSCVVNCLLRATVGAAAARASRSKLSESSKTAFLALGSVNCPATSRACSARSSQSRASFKFDGMWSSLRGFVSLHLFLAKVAFCATKATPRLGVARHFVVHWLVLSVPLQTWECRRPDHPNHPLPMKHEESSRMNRQKAVPTRVR